MKLMIILNIVSVIVKIVLEDGIQAINYVRLVILVHYVNNVISIILREKVGLHLKIIINVLIVVKRQLIT